MTSVLSGGNSRRRRRQSWCGLACASLALWCASDLFAQADRLPGGHSRPQSVSVAKPVHGAPAPTTPFVLVNVAVQGTNHVAADELAAALRCRPGQTPSQQRVSDDVESLLATGRFTRVRPRWQPSAEGWTLLYEVVDRSEPLAVRAQSEDVPAAGHSPPPPPLKNMPAPFRPSAPEDEPGGDRGASSFTLDEPLHEVRVEGLSTIPQADVNKHIKTRPGRTVTQQMVKDDVDALVRTRWFASVEPILKRTSDGLVLTFRVLERPIVRRVEFRGNKKIKKDKLEALTGLKIGSAYDVSANRECARRIEEMYHEKGFAFATVELERGDAPDDREVVFAIHEGPKVHVTSVKFEGNQFFSDALLELKLRTKKRMFWVFGGKYDPATIPDDIASVRQYYHSLGFFDVDIKPDQRFSEDKAKVQIVYSINEGVRYKVRQINISGNEVLSEADLRQDQTVAEGEFYTERKLEADVQKMREAYGRLGRMFAKVEPVRRFSEEPGVVDILYRIDEDKVYRVREINVHIAGDHPHTRTNLVRNLSMIQPGDLADPVMLQKTRRRLEGSGYFETGPENGPRLDIKPVSEPGWIQTPQVDVARGQDEVTRGQDDEVLLAQTQGPLKQPQNYIFDTRPQGDPLAPALRDPDPNIWEQLPPPEFIDIDAYLAEARTGRLMFGVGVNSNSGLVGNIVLSENNFDILRPPTSLEDIWNGTAWRGGGQKFRIEALPGTQVSRYLVDWQDPYFLDSNVNLGVSGFYYTRFYRHWNETRPGGRVRLGQQLNQQWSVAAALRAEGVHITDIPVGAPPDLNAVDGDNFLSTVRLSLMHDTRDAAFIPAAGHYLEFSVEQAFGEFNYTRYEVEGRQYFTTHQRPDGGGKHILSLNGQLGFTGDSTPIFERFYAGGFQSFRGFAFRGVTPLENGIEVGGQFQMLGTVEYMLPVMANEMVKVVGFSDFGTVDRDVTLENFRVSVGAGLRVVVPGMGPVPIALDWAVPIVKKDFDREQLFSFYIGINR